MTRKGISEEDRSKRIYVVNEAFPDAMVENYEPLVEMLDLPDEKDKHVLAAAIKTNANLIVNNNLKDFPADYLASFSLSAKTLMIS
jgi:predicted nucleic acid-binding protein